jgi:polyribonucleotide nucleotidyltransferase
MAAKQEVEAITQEAEVGKTYEGRVVSIRDFGAFVEIFKGKDGLLHVSELSDDYVASVSDVLKVGDSIAVKVISIDDQDRIRLSHKATKPEGSEGSSERREDSGRRQPGRNDSGSNRDRGRRGRRRDSDSRNSTGGNRERPDRNNDHQRGPSEDGPR